MKTECIFISSSNFSLFIYSIHLDLIIMLMWHFQALGKLSDPESHRNPIHLAMVRITTLGLLGTWKRSEHLEHANVYITLIHSITTSGGLEWVSGHLEFIQALGVRIPRTTPCTWKWSTLPSSDLPW